MALENHTGCKLVSKQTAFPDMLTFGNDDLTPSVLNGNVFQTAVGHAAPRNIVMFDDGVNGQVVFIVSSNPANPTTVVAGANMLINGNWVDGAFKSLTVVFDGAAWREISRV